MPTKNIGKTLKKLRLEAGLSQEQAYEYIGVVQSTFSSWETGKALKHSPEGAQTIDTVLEKEYSIANQLKEQQEYIVELQNLSREDHQRNTQTRLINYYYRLTSAGTGQIIFDTPPTKRIEIPDIPKYKHVDYAIGVNGVSMEPTYKDNDTLLVEMTDEVDKGEVGVFSVNNDCYVKKLGDGELISLNHDFPNIPLNESSRYMGKVIDKLGEE